MLMFLGVFAQEFFGYVKRADTSQTPLFQAKIGITNQGKKIKELQSYFDGSFHFQPSKSETYVVKISYPGYRDTMYFLTSDKNGIIKPDTVTVRLVKDGLRLVGTIRADDDNFPLRKTTIVLKNVMTRKEDRITTGIDGYFNFKMEYETNYKVSIDRYSEGIFNKYKDTTFYVSTVGFNQPLDYRIDIFLKPATQTIEPLEDYDATKGPQTQNVKPVIDVVGRAAKSNAPMKDPAPDEVAMVKKPEEAEGKKEKSKKIEKPTEVQVIRDEPAKPADNKSNLVADSLARVKLEQEKTAAELAVKARKKAYDDSLALAINEAKKKATRDSLERAKAITSTTDVLAAAKKSFQDSIARLLVATQKKAVEDSIQRAKLEKERKDKELALRKAFVDSISRVVAAANKKRIDDSIAVVLKAQRKKAVDDSIAKVNAERERELKEQATKKAKQDSITRALALAKEKLVKDSLDRIKAQEDKLAAEKAAKKMVQDSIVKALEAAHKKFVKDSIAHAKAEQARIEQELKKQKAFEDSILNVLALARKKIVADSIAHVKAEKARIAKEQAEQKAFEDSVIAALTGVKPQPDKNAIALAKKATADSLKAVAKEKRKKFVEDSLAHIALKKARLDSIAAAKEEQRKVQIQIEEGRKQFVADSIAFVKEEQEKKRKEAAEKKAAADLAAKARKKAVDDSMAVVKKAERTRFIEDSLAKVAIKKIRDDSIAAAKAELRKKQDALIAQRKQFVADSLEAVKTAQAKKAKEAADKKAAAELAAQARKKVMDDSIAVVRKAERIRFVNDSIAKAAIKKARQDSIATAKAEQKKRQLALEEERKKYIADSIAQAKTNEQKRRLAIEEERKKFVADSIAFAKKEIERKAKEKAAAEARKKTEDSLKVVRKKFVDDSIAQAVVKKNKQDSIAGARKFVADSIARAVKAAKKKHDEDSIATAILKKNREDSLAGVKKFVADSIARAKAEQEKRTKEELAAKARKKVVDDSLARLKATVDAAAKKAIDDSIAHQKAVQERLNKDKARAAERIRLEDSVRAAKAKEDAGKTAAENEFAKESRKLDEVATNTSKTDTFDIKIPVILFEKNSYTLSEQGMRELTDLAFQLNTNPTAKLVIYSMASADETNQRQTSLKRSEAVLRFMMLQGLGVGRVKSVYYGSSVSRNGCKAASCPEAMQQQNRCVAYQVIW